MNHPDPTDIVVELYLTPWDQALSRARELCPVDQVDDLLQTLVKAPGWRERVVAAMFMAAFEHYEYTESLLQSFRDSPEYYTCSAFARMFAHWRTGDAVDGLKRMRAWCPEGGRGDDLRSIVDRTLAGLE